MPEDRQLKVPSSDERPLYLQLTHMYAPSWGYGGPVRLMSDYARWLNGAFRVLALSGDLHHDFTRIHAAHEDQDGVKVQRFRVHLPALARKSIYLVSPRMCLRAAALIRKSTASSVVHVTELRGVIPLYALFLKLLFGRRIFLVHSAFGGLHKKPGWRRKVFDAIFMKAFIRKIDLRLTQNDHEFGAYQTLCRTYGCVDNSKTILLPLHVDVQPLQDGHFGPTGKNREAVRENRRKYGIPEDAVVFIFLGRLHPEKGILRMIDAHLEFSRRSRQRTLLLIVGRDDGFQARIEGYVREREITDKVRIINGVYSERFHYYYLSDVFLGFPTIFEETMLASVEALTCGTPIIVSREADVPFVEDEGAGRVLDFDVATAAATMLAFSLDLLPLQVKAREVALRHFRGCSVSQSLLHLLQKSMLVNNTNNLRDERKGETETDVFPVEASK